MPGISLSAYSSARSAHKSSARSADELAALIAKENGIQSSSSRRFTILVLATAAAIAVSNIYFPQPLLAAIAHSFEISEKKAGLIATAGQMGYAIGIALVVPLTDAVDLRRLGAVLPALTSLGLLAGAAAPNTLTLTIATLALSTTTVLPQIIMPVAASLAAPERVGRTMSAVSVGLTLGTLLSRTASGAISDLGGGWRSVYLIAAVLTGALVLVLPRHLPVTSGRARIPYGKLLVSMPRLLVLHRELRTAAFLGGTFFAAFAAFWATLAFHLAEPVFHMGSGYAGLFGLFSVPGALLAVLVGRLNDRYGFTAVTSVATLSLILCFSILGLFGDTSVVALIIGSNLLSFGAGSSTIANQARIFGISEEIRGRVNTVYMVSTFAGGAIGSLIATVVYDSHGWTGMIASCFVWVALAVAGFALGTVRQRPTAVATVQEQAARPGSRGRRAKGRFEPPSRCR
ncbi:MFS transporter [Streptomyces sp. NPDC048506]|uniref:MFS transporter n=1 Tax=Streptomyces sp. NPDC048506 TaxID=3155028 RepID=UPI003442010F